MRGYILGEVRVDSSYKLPHLHVLAIFMFLIALHRGNLFPGLKAWPALYHFLAGFQIGYCR